MNYLVGTMPWPHLCWIKSPRQTKKGRNMWTPHTWRPYMYPRRACAGRVMACVCVCVCVCVCLLTAEKSAIFVCQRTVIRVRKLFMRKPYSCGLCAYSWGPLANMRVTPRSQVGERQAFGSLLCQIFRLYFSMAIQLQFPRICTVQFVHICAHILFAPRVCTLVLFISTGNSQKFWWCCLLSQKLSGS